MTSFLGVGLILLAIGFSLSAHGLQQSDSTEQAEGLARLAPTIDTRQTSLRSFHFSARVDMGFDARLRCFFVAPSNRACVAFHDDIPVFVAAGDRIVTYNPLDGVLQWQGDWRVIIGTLPDGRLTWQYAITNAGPDTRIEIDLAAIVAGAPRQRTARPQGGGKFVLEGYTERGSRVEASVEPIRTPPYSQLRIHTSQGVFLIESLVGNEAIPPTVLQFPRFEDVMSLPQAVPVTLENVGQAVSRGFVDMFIRAPMRKPEQRSETEAKLGRKVDWDALPQRDATEGQRLREVVERHFRGVP